jgi:hypothetical protein
MYFGVGWAVPRRRTGRDAALADRSASSVYRASRKRRTYLLYISQGQKVYRLPPLVPSILGCRTAERIDAIFNLCSRHSHRCQRSRDWSRQRLQLCRQIASGCGQGFASSKSAGQVALLRRTEESDVSVTLPAIRHALGRSDREALERALWGAKARTRNQQHQRTKWIPGSA